MNIDFTKPVQTRDGRAVRILCTDRTGSNRSIVGLVVCWDGTDILYEWFTDGGVTQSRATGRQYPDDLINVPQKRPHYDLIIAWANGATIEYYSDTHESWIEIATAPNWNPSTKYRIKE